MGPKLQAFRDTLVAIPTVPHIGYDDGSQNHGRDPNWTLTDNRARDLERPTLIAPKTEAFRAARRMLE
jgi:hypothetical protein